MDKEEVNELCPKMTFKRVIHENTGVIQGKTGVIQESGTQSKVKEIKVNKTKAEENTGGNVHRFYQENFGMANSHIIQDLESWSNDLSSEVVLLALQKAIEKDAPYSYAKAIMKNWAAKDIKTVEDAEAESLSKRKQKTYSTKSKARSESLPKWARADYEPEKDKPLSAEEKAEMQRRIAEFRAMKPGKE